MSFLYPRVVAITRPGAQPVVVGFQGEAPSADPSLETAIASGLPANIQAKGAGGKDPVGMPGGGAQQTWHCFLPLSAIAPGVAQNRDVITDDLGRRFQIVADYVNSLGPNFICERLEA